MKSLICYHQTVKPLLEENLKHGARVISRHFTFDGWTPDFEWNNFYFLSLALNK